MNRNYIRQNITSISLIIFISIYSAILYFQPGFLYNNDGSLRQFGINSSKKTVLPVWLLAIIISIASYFLVLYYLALPKFIE
jgi:hypothetical protein